ncbi:conserved hypothetical protein [delta proteobacterium NaphS2]|nr:conserved hypothetical protein [delta proteobacterium NaphS2]
MALPARKRPKGSDTPKGAFVSWLTSFGKTRIESFLFLLLKAHTLPPRRTGFERT